MERALFRINRKTVILKRVFAIKDDASRTLLREVLIYNGRGVPCFIRTCMKNKPALYITTASVLIAISILLPATVPLITFSPLMTMLVAVHVPIFIACFIKPSMAIAVTISSSIAFFFTMPIIVTARISTHILFAVLLSLYM